MFRLNMMTTFLGFLEKFTLSITQLETLTVSNVLTEHDSLDIPKNIRNWSTKATNHILSLQWMSARLIELATELHELIKLELNYDVTVIFNSVVLKMCEMFDAQKRRSRELIFLTQERLNF